MTPRHKQFAFKCFSPPLPPSAASLVLFDVFVVFFLLAASHDSLCYE